MVTPAVRELRCEYCHAPEEVTGGRYQVDHILPRSLGGGDELANLAFGCSGCNLAKSNHVSGLDPGNARTSRAISPQKRSMGRAFRLCQRDF